jgi:hypothetical protein
VQREGDKREIAQRFDEFVHALYWKSKHVPAVISIARGGIHYCLTKMDGAADAEERLFFGRQAKKIANNLGSYVWPGWDEPGIALSQGDVAAGLDAAKLRLRLAMELGDPPERLENAYWLLGAHLLAADDPSGALDHFRQCSPEKRPLFAGYVLLADVVLQRRDAQREFDDLIAHMSATDDEERTFNQTQLATAHRVFVQGRARA